MLEEIGLPRLVGTVLNPRAAGRHGARAAAAAWAAAAPWGGYSHGELERPGGPGPGHGDRDSGV